VSQYDDISLEGPVRRAPVAASGSPWDAVVGDMRKTKTYDANIDIGGNTTQVRGGQIVGLGKTAAPDPYHDVSLDEQSGTTSVAAAPSSAPSGFFDTVLPGIGHGMVATAQTVKQGIDKLASAVAETPFGASVDRFGQSLGMPGAQQAEAATAQQIAERKQYAAPLLATTGGKVGDFLGQAATVAPTVLIPGANTYLGASLIGAGTGLATTEGGLAERAKGAAFGAAGGVLGKGVGDAIGAGVGKLATVRSADLASEAAQNSQRDAAIGLARQHGYKLAPQDVNPSLVNAALEGVSGKIKTSQAASQSNQSITNNLVRGEFGLPEGVPLNTATLGAIRTQAGNAYNVVRGTGTVTPGPSYAQAIDGIINQANGQAKSFPGLKNDTISEVLTSLKQPTFVADDAVDATRFLRNLADKAYASGDKQTGSAFKQASGALEDALDGHLAAMGQPDALAAFRSARQTIAKTYSVEKALNPVTGNVDAQSLASQLKRGKPLSGNLEAVATVASAFPKAMQTLKQNYNPSSPLDYATALMASGGRGLGTVATLAARPLTRATILSGPVQSLNAKLATDYSGGALSNLIYPGLTSEPLRDMLRVGGTAGAVNASK
jgi:hypothetical protein